MTGPVPRVPTPERSGVPDISVVIPVINGEGRLPACLEALRGTRARIEVVLVDNGSSDDSVDTARAAWPGVVVVSNPTNEGFAPACNQGARAAAGRYLLFLNDDALVGLSTLDDLLAAADRDEVAAAWQPPLVSADGLVWDSAGSRLTPVGLLWHEPAGKPVTSAPLQAARVFASKGACMLVRTSNFWEVGGFDASYFAYFEETDLCWRLALRGYTCWLVDAAPVRHVGGATATRLFTPGELDYMFFRNRLTSVLTLPGPRTLATMVPLHLLAVAGLIVVAMLTGHAERARGVMRAVAWVPAHRRELWERRRAEQRARTVGDDAVFRGVTTRPKLRALAAAGLGYLGNGREPDRAVGVRDH